MNYLMRNMRCLLMLVLLVSVGAMRLRDPRRDLLRSSPYNKMEEEPCFHPKTYPDAQVYRLFPNSEQVSIILNELNTNSGFKMYSEDFVAGRPIDIIVYLEYDQNFNKFITTHNIATTLINKIYLDRMDDCNEEEDADNSRNIYL